MANDYSQINPDLRPTVNLNKFRFWCQKVLPLVYDDSISYYEVLGKMVVYLNQVIDNVNADTENVLTLKEAFVELQEYVADVIHYDIHDLEEAVATAVHAAEFATEAETTVQGYADSASESKTAAQNAASSASTSASNASDSAINAANSAIIASNMAENASNSATNAANSAINAINQAEDAENSAISAHQAAITANAASDIAETEALKSEGYAIGKQNGEDVSSGSPYYHKNAKYYAEQAGQGVGAVPLADLPDTLIVNPTNGQVLAYDSTSEMWKNSDEVEGVTSLDNLTDTDIDVPTAGQVLMYNQTTQKWYNSDENEVAISPSAPSNPDTKLWINETAQTPIVIPTSEDLDAVQTQVNNLSTALTSGLNTKADKTTVTTLSAPTALTLADNREYYLTNVANLTITFPSGNFECWLSITTSGSFTRIILPNNATYIGDNPVFAAGEKWEVSIKNGTVIAGKVE